eukprot:TRINITY_DN10454_c2_g2_i1.p1 TRINITY_DN10454_c2_g2~~TRINITY_DN10454_c2_g2_i1.p1  ORF type:complete len:257 (+),score=41.12 TRINITY_DN10454_c2_g2_i1:68-772(+)
MFQVTVKCEDVGKASVLSALMGSCMTAGSILAYYGISTASGTATSVGMWSVGIALFHQGEYSCMAYYRPREFSVKSFLLPGVGASRNYNVAMAVAALEYVIEWFLFPRLKQNHLKVSIAGGVLMMFAAIVRIAAMVQCGSNFSHVIEDEKRESHKLVTSGLFSVLRHPSYFGWFYWSISTQIVLLNPVSFLLYTAAAWTFFHQRIPVEEEILTEFFPNYPQYRKKTMTGIPFIW